MRPVGTSATVQSPIYTITLAVPAQSIVVPSGVLGGTDYFLELNAKNAIASASEVAIYANGDTTDANYYTRQNHNGTDGGASYPRLTYLYSSRKATVQANIGTFDSKFWWIAQHLGEYSTTYNPYGYGTRGYKVTGAVATITGLEIRHEQVDGFAVGTRLRLYSR